MKRMGWLVFAVVITVLMGCAGNPPTPSPPLHTNGNAAPPAVCKTLRDHGGRC